MEIASPPHLTDRPSESDTDPAELPTHRPRGKTQPKPKRKLALTPEITDRPSSDESAVEVVDLTGSQPRRRGATNSQTVAEADTTTPTSAMHASASSKIAPSKRIFVKSRPGAKTGTDNFVDTTSKIAQETPHTFTLTDGRVIRKNLTRTFLDPPRRGTFGTPPRLLYERVFVSPSATRAYQASLSAAARASRRLRNRYLSRLTSPAAQQPATTAPRDPSPPRRSTRARKAVVVPGAVPIAYTSRAPTTETVWLKCEPEDPTPTADPMTDPLEPQPTLPPLTPFRRLDDIPLHRLSFYPKSAVVRRLLPTPDPITLAAKIQDATATVDPSNKDLLQMHIDVVHETVHWQCLRQAKLPSRP